MHGRAVVRCAQSGVGLSTVLLNNGVAISERLARELVACEIAVMVSLDGMGAAHDAQRPTLSGRPSSAMVVRSIDRLIRAGLPPHISITIIGRNVEAIAPLVRFILERDLTFSFSFFRDNACAAGFANLQYEEKAVIEGLRQPYAVVEELLPLGASSAPCWTAVSSSSPGRRRVV